MNPGFARGTAAGCQSPGVVYMLPDTEPFATLFVAESAYRLSVKGHFHLLSPPETTRSAGVRRPAIPHTGRTAIVESAQMHIAAHHLKTDDGRVFFLERNAKRHLPRTMQDAGIAAQPHSRVAVVK